MGRVLIPYRHEHKVTPYVEAVRLGGADAVAVHVGDRPRMDGFHGLLLTGGTDVNPARYGQVAHEETDPPDDERDEVEWKLVDEALERDAAILAICRGLQLLNVHHGGTLRQHLGIAEHDSVSEDSSVIAHEIILDEKSHLANVYGQTRLHVNSRHHQAVDHLGSSLRVSACAANHPEIVEGLEEPARRFLLAVQWHPEDQVRRHEEQRRLFERFAKAAKT